MNFGPLEIGVILLIVLVIFGPKRLPQLGRSLGSGMREFKDAVTGKDKDEPAELEKPATTAEPVAQTAQPQAAEQQAQKPQEQAPAERAGERP